MHKIINEFFSKEYLFQYYQNHFILFRDLGPIFNIDQDSLEQCYQKENQTMWEQICEIEKQRQFILQQDSQKLIKFAELIDNLVECRKRKTDNEIEIFGKLSSLIQNTELMVQLVDHVQPSYFRTQIKSVNFITSYLNQQNYDMKNLIERFQICSRATERLYLYHPFVFHLLSTEVQQYIQIKRQVAHMNGLKNKQNSFIQNKSYENMARNEKGQFVKKYQSAETKNEM